MPEETAGLPVRSPAAPSRAREGALPPEPVSEQELATRLETDPVLNALIEEVPNAKARGFLRAYRIMKRKNKAAEAAGVSLAAHRYWLGTMHADPVPGYPAAYEAIDEEIDVYWEELAQLRAVEGITEETYDGEGNLIRRRVRHDPSFLKMVLGGRMPEKYGRGSDHPGAMVNVIIEMVDE